MMTKNQIENAQERIKNVNGNVRKISAEYQSLSRILKELRLDSDLKKDAETVYNALGLDVFTTPADVKSVLHAIQIRPTKVGKETMDCMCVFVNKVVTDEIEATLPDGSTKKVRVARVDADGNKVTEVVATPIKPGKWTVSLLFKLLSQAVVLNA